MTHYRTYLKSPNSCTCAVRPRNLVAYRQRTAFVRKTVSVEYIHLWPSCELSENHLLSATIGYECEPFTVLNLR